LKASHFVYHEPQTIDEAVAVLHEHADEAKPLAGGQSLVPILALRLARFDHLIDLNHVEELAGIGVGPDGLRIGAMTRQAVAEHSGEVSRGAPLLGRALPFIGHFQIRNRGTVGGSIAHADPASELPAVALALDAEMAARSVRGERRIAASDFFSSIWETALEPDEILSAVHIPRWPARSGFAFEELAWRLGDFAIAGVASGVSLDGAGRVERSRVVLMGMGTTPLRAASAEAAMLGEVPADLDFAALSSLALEGTNPIDDIHASADYRRRVTVPMVSRVLQHALEEASRG
jgi:carbon-monoxide dehydrogenase medium subunit